MLSYYAPILLTNVSKFCTFLYMPQINIHTTPEFEQALERLMSARHIRHKSEAIRLAVEEAAVRCRSQPGLLSRLRGLAKGPSPNPNPRFRGHAEVWRSDCHGD